MQKRRPIESTQQEQEDPLEQQQLGHMSKRNENGKIILFIHSFIQQ